MINHYKITATLPHRTLIFTLAEQPEHIMLAAIKQAGIYLYLKAPITKLGTIKVEEISLYKQRLLELGREGEQTIATLKQRICELESTIERMQEGRPDESLSRRM